MNQAKKKPSLYKNHNPIRLSSTERSELRKKRKERLNQIKKVKEERESKA